MSPEQARSHETVIDIKATPDEVFRAVSDAEEIVRWFAPQAKVEPGPDGKMEGGTYSISWGGPMSDPSTISHWEPGKRFTGYKDRSAAYGKAAPEDAPMQRIVVDYLIESLGGGVTRLRLVHSGFGTGEGWDSEFESTRMGWPLFLQIMKQGLEKHKGEDSQTLYVMVPTTQSQEEVWKRLAPAEGPRYTLPLGGGIEGQTQTYEAGHAFVGTMENVGDGLIGILCAPKMVSVCLTLWGKTRERAEEIQTEWKAAIEKVLA